MLLFGAMDMLRGVAAPFLQHSLSLTYFQLGLLFSMNSVGYLAGSFMSGFAVETIGLKPVKLIGAAAMAGGLLWFVRSSGFAEAAFGYALAGMGGGWLEIGINGMIPALTSNERTQAKYFNWLHGVYGFGAFVFPVLAAWLIAALHGWRPVFGVMFGCTVVLLTLVALANYQGLHVARQGKKDPVPMGVLLKNPHLYGLLAAILTYVMAEGGIGAWLPTYLVHDRGLSLGQGSVYLSAFYLLFTIGRLTAHTWVHRLGNLSSVALAALVAISCLVIGAVGQGYFTAFLALAGFGFAPIFPTITAAASHRFADHAGKVLGLLFAAAGIGSLAANALIGSVAAAFGMRAGFLLIPVFLIFVVGSIGAVAAFWRRQGFYQ